MNTLKGLVKTIKEAKEDGIYNLAIKDLDAMLILDGKFDAEVKTTEELKSITDYVRTMEDVGKITTQTSSIENKNLRLDIYYKNGKKALACRIIE